ncbi:MAG: RluA family pseudouridine synthase [Acidobacteriota bacterium]|nr:RluA family pseudouridine synthase [Acidobacteriota bacterium]
MAVNRGWSYREQVTADAHGCTVLAHLAASRRHSTAREWSDRIRRGEVEVDEVVAEPETLLRAGQALVWHRPPWHEPEVPQHFEVIHEDAAIVAVTKPSGLPTMPAGGFLDHTLLALVRARYPEASPLHRLGRHTSGIVLFARTHAAAAALSRSWRDHDVKKHYLALASGVAARDTFSIEAPIGPVPHPTLGEVYAASAGGKPSHSVATVLERRHPIKGCPTDEGSTLFEVEITTGRPHQVRIHLAYAGHPLTGDPLYDTGGVIKSHPGLPGDGGYLLHAARLAFVHPLTGAEMVLDAASSSPQALKSSSPRVSYY